MADVVLRAILMGDSAGLVRSMDEAAASTDAASKAMQDSSNIGTDALGDLGGAGRSAGDDLEKLGKDADESHSHLGKLFSDMGNWMSNNGIPFGETFTKIGDKMEETGEKGSSVFQKLSNVGGIALGALAVGAVAFGAESIEMADKFDEAQSQLQVAVKNSGASFDSFKPKIDAAYGSMANLGFNSTDTAQSLTTLITSTGSTTKSLDMLSTAADLARFKHISLASASQLLAKVMAGSNRVVTQLGLNLDIGTGKLSSITTATDSLHTAQLNLSNVQKEVNAKVYTGAEADAMLASAHNAVAVASQKLRMDTSAVGDVMDAIKKKTEGAAAAYGQTLPGEFDIARAHIHDFGTDIGVVLEPVLKDVFHWGNEFLSWLLRCKPALIAVGSAIGLFLGGTIAIFLANQAIKFKQWVVESISNLFGLGGATEATSAAQKAAAVATQGAAEAQQQLALSLEETVPAAGAAAAGLEGTGTAATTAGQLINDAGEEGGIGMSELLGPIGLVIMAATEIATHWKEVFRVLKDTWHAIEIAGITVWDALKRFFDDWWKVIAAVFTDGLSFIVPYLIDHWHDIETDAEDVWHDILSFFKDVWSDIKAVFYDATIVGLILSHWNTIRSDAVRVWDDIVSWLSGIPDKILHALGDFGSLLLNAGKAIMEGLLHGLESGFDAVKGFLDHVGHDVVSIVKDPLKIFSPSAVFHDIGVNIMAGLRNGIADAAPSALGELGSVANQLKLAPFTVPSVAEAGSGGASTAAAVGQGFGAGGAAASSSGRNITQINQFQGVVNAQEIAAVASRELAWAAKTAPV